MSTIKENVRASIRRLRYEYKGKLTQADLSKKLGVAPNTISRWETGFYEPSFDQIEKLAGFFRVHYGEFFKPAETA